MDELSDDEEGTDAATLQQSHRDLESLDSDLGPRVQSDRLPAVNSVRSTESLRTGPHRDTITLRAFDENLDPQATIAASDLGRVSNVIGMYADPAAERDDWGDDFDLEVASSRPEGSSGSRTVEEGPSSAPSWFVENEGARHGFEFKEMEEATLMGSASRNAYQFVTAEVLVSGDDGLRMRGVPESAFATPMLTYSSLLTFPGVGYKASLVHPSCIRVKELFSRYQKTIRRHFDALVRDSGGTIALDGHTRAVYNLSGDADVARLATRNKDLAADVLSWKLQWATLNRNPIDHAKHLLAVAKIFKSSTNFREALRLVREGIRAVAHAEESGLSVAIAVELEYEHALLNRALGALNDCDQAIRRAMALSSQLSSKEEVAGDLLGPQQRGLWWQLRCKFLMAEVAFELKNMDAAVQFFSEYIVESVTRMIGLISPPRAEDSTLGTEFMRYCLFSPRRLVLAMWTTLICLGEQRCFAAAADIAGLTSFVASSFGYEDVNSAAASVRVRVKEIAADLRRQYDDISKSIMQSSAAVAKNAENAHGGSGLEQIPISQFDYNVGDFGDVGDEVEEDWDAQLERELNIKIERCCDVDQSVDASIHDADGNPSPSLMNGEIFATPFPNSTSTTDLRGAFSGKDEASGGSRNPDHTTLRWEAGPRKSNLMEAELRQYLGRVAGAASTLSTQQMFPKPTQPFDGRLMGPREHEEFLRSFVRSKDSESNRRSYEQNPSSVLWEPSISCKLNMDFQDLKNVTISEFGADVLVPEWGLQVLAAIWKVVRSNGELRSKQLKVRQLILNSFSRFLRATKRTPAHTESERQSRLGVFAALLDSLRIAREIVTNDGAQASWFSRASIVLGVAAKTVTPAAKAAAELFQAESRAHCGIQAVVSRTLLDRCKRNMTDRSKQDRENKKMREKSTTSQQTATIAPHIPPTLRQTVVDVLHALYWRTKASFDESSDADSLERLIHAEVASTLFLTGSGVSPVDGSSVDLASEAEILCLSEKKKKNSGDSKTFVDETRRVSSSELIDELQSLWSSLPSSAGTVRAKVSYALAIHSNVEQRNYGRAERFLFDGLRSVHAISTEQGYPHSFFSTLIFVCPVSVASAPMAEAILRAYGTLAVSHSKYRYGLAALEAATDACRVRCMDARVYRSALSHVIDVARKNSDWRRAIVLLYNLRSLVHPKDGLRNEFLQVCIQLHRICFDVGCFEASIVPLRAYSTLIYEERLRVLLQRYRRRLAKKTRNRFRRHLPSSPLPKILPGGSVFPNGKNTLASFFETPVATATYDNTVFHSTSRFEMRARSTTALLPMSTTRHGGPILRRLAAILWPLSVSGYPSTQEAGKSYKSSATSPADVNKASSANLTSNQTAKGDVNPKAAKNVLVAGALHEDDGHFKEEQRELLRIEAEQEAVPDCDRFQVELLRAQTDYTKADFAASEQRCRGLLDMRISHAGRFKVLGVLARIRLKRREITRCLELIDQMEREHRLAEASQDSSPSKECHQGHENQRVSSLFRLHDSGQDPKENEKHRKFVPEVTFLRVSALIHGGRLNEALYVADNAVELCPKYAFWNLGRLHYLRGKAMFAMSSTAMAPIDKLNEAEMNGEGNPELDLKIVELTMMAFETASRYYDAAGDEICAAKSDLRWARTCIDLLFRRTVLRSSCGGGMTLASACQILEKRIDLDEVLETVYGVTTIAQAANIPLLLIDAMAALAEIKCIQKQPPSSWLGWISEAWKLFSRLFTDAEDFTVVLGSMAPVSTLFRLRNMCGRLVRVIMCDDHNGHVSDMNKHLRLFEAYVTLQISIERKMNLASSAHTQETSFTMSPENPDNTERPTNHSSPANSTAETKKADSNPAASKSKGVMRRKLSVMYSGSDRGAAGSVNETASDRLSETTTERSAPRRPPGAFLHILGDEGVALGRQGFSVFINRPRQQVISAVKGTGAVLIPTNFFSNSKAAPGNNLGTDAEMIYPFKPSLGLGAMQILDDEIQSGTTAASRTLSDHHAVAPEGTLPHKQTISFFSEPVAIINHQTEEKSSDGDDERISETKMDISIRRETTESARQTFRSARNGEVNDERHIETEDNKESDRSNPTGNTRNGLAELIKAVLQELNGGNILTKGSSAVFGESVAERVWSHMQRIKTETKRYMHGEISLEQLGERNSDALLGWVHCIPLSRREWPVPESIGRRLVYVLYAHGIVGYYSVERGGSIERIAFGGKQHQERDAPLYQYSPTHGVANGADEIIRSPTNTERLYLSELVRGFKRDDFWHKNRDSEIVNGLAKNVLRAPRSLLSSSSPAQKSRSRPIVLITDLPLQIIPWELFFDHVVIRSHCLLDVIRGLQEESELSSNALRSSEDPAIAASRKIARFISFGPSRREILDMERTEDARRQQLAFQALLRLNHMNATSLIAFLGLGGFSDPTALNAVARPTGPLSSPLSQSRKAVKLFGLRISANIGRRNYPHMDFLKVPGLGSATTADLKEAAMVLQPSFNDKDEPRRDLGAYIPVFMFSYADLVDSSDSVFGLRQLVPSCILMFTPAIHMKVLARHLQDDELSAELGRASGRINNRIFPDVTASARVLVEYVSRFSREKRIPIVVFLGQGLVDVFPRKRGFRLGGVPKPSPGTERLVQFSGAGRVEYFPRNELL